MKSYCGSTRREWMSLPLPLAEWIKTSARLQVIITLAILAATLPQHVGADDSDTLKHLMLERINAERADRGLAAVGMGNNTAAQAHAENMMKWCFSGHWGVDGLKPYMRYSLAGGYQSNAENVSGLSYCVRAEENYARTSPEREVDDSMDGLMDSPGHRANILDPRHSRVNLGLAWNEYSMAVVQQFEYDYVEFGTIPNIRDGILEFSGTAKNGIRFASSQDMGVSLYYDPPPQNLTVGQISRTYCYGSGVPVAWFREPLTDGYYYTDDSWSSEIETCPDPYRISPGIPPPDSPGDAHMLYQQAKSASLQSQEITGMWQTADAWVAQGDVFAMSSNISGILAGSGPGVYTVMVWDVSGSDGVPIAKYSMFHGISPPTGYGEATPAPPTRVIGVVTATYNNATGNMVVVFDRNVTLLDPGNILLLDDQRDILTDMGSASVTGAGGRVMWFTMSLDERPVRPAHLELRPGALGVNGSANAWLQSEILVVP